MKNTRIILLTLICTMVAAYVMTPLLAIQSAEAADTKPSKEYLIKAAYILNFLRFVEWPESRSSGSYHICIVGTDPFGSALDPIEKRTILDRSIQVKRNVSISDADHCHLVFVSNSEAGRLSAVIESLQGKAILTVSEIEGFANNGGVVELYYKNDFTIGFKIAPELAKQLGLKISSKLLELATIVSKKSQ